MTATDTSPLAIRALVFNVFRTLVDWRSGIADPFSASGGPGDPEELADAWRALRADHRRGQRPQEAVGRFRRAPCRDARRVLTEPGSDLPIESRRRLVSVWHRGKQDDGREDEVLRDAPGRAMSAISAALRLRSRLRT
jgi:hypothetical protein